MSSSDALILLRASIAASKAPQLTCDPAAPVENATDSFVEASHLYFPYPTPQCLPLTTTTRFTSTSPDTVQVDLRSIYFAWVKKDVTVPEYIASAQDLDQQLPEGQKIRNLVFVERLELMTWLEGATEDSEYIEPSEDAPGTEGAAGKAAEITGGAGVPAQPGTGQTVTQQLAGRPVRVIDARLQTIYNGERSMLDHNSILRGIKPTVRTNICSHHHLPLLTQAGLLPCSQACRTLPRKAKNSAGCKAGTPTVQDTSNTTCTRAHQAAAVEREFETLRPHHPPFTLSLLTTAHVQH